jgi:hypothetical protein
MRILVEQWRFLGVVPMELGMTISPRTQICLAAAIISGGISVCRFDIVVIDEGSSRWMIKSRGHTKECDT